MNIFKVFQGKLLHIQKEDINTGSKNFFKLKFDFDESWNEFVNFRFVEFYQNVECSHFKVEIDENGISNIPIDVLHSTLPIYIGVCAENIDGTIIANTNFVKVNSFYGANTEKNNVNFPESSNNLYALYSPNNNLRYLRVNNGILEFSKDNKNWVSISGGVDEEKLKEIITEETKGIKNEVNDLIASPRVVNITTMEKRYKPDELPTATASDNGKTILVDDSDGLYAYSYDSSISSWTKKYKIRSHALYLNLQDGCMYRYTMTANTEPYPNFIQMTISVDTLNDNFEELSSIKADKSLVNDLKTQVDINAQIIAQSGLGYKADTVDTYTERQTAEGLNILDGQKSLLKKVEGNTVACKNLFILENVIGYNSNAVYDENEQALSINISAYYWDNQAYFYKIQGKENTQYTFTANIKQPDGLRISVVFNYSDGTMSNQINRVLVSEYGLYTATSEKGKTLIALSWQYDGGGYWSYLRNIRLNEGTVDLGYQPLFTGLKSATFSGIESTSQDGEKVNTFAFPKTETPLGTTLDFERQVIENYGYEIVLTGKENFIYTYYENEGKPYNTVYLQNVMNTDEFRNTNAVATDGSFPSDTVFAYGMWWIGLNDRVLYWVGILDLLGFTDSWADKSSPLSEERANAITQFKSYLAERYASGNPVTIRYVTRVSQFSRPFTEEQKASGNEILAYLKGTEKVESDNAEYGANTTLTQNYLFVTEVKQ